MPFLLISVFLFACSGIFAAVFQRKKPLSHYIGVVGAAAGSVFGLAGAVAALNSDVRVSLAADWAVPAGAIELGADKLSAFFLGVLFMLSFASSIYAAEYLLKYQSRRNLGLHWFFFNFFIAAMALVLTAQDGLLFLYAWEAMSIFSFFLVIFEHESFQVRRAGFVYLVAAHIGTACLIVAFLLLGANHDSFAFSQFAVTGQRAAAVFILGLIGFGMKAGVVPLHIWLPEAHPAAPSHVSALMSGVMIKLGIYGLLRTLTFISPIPEWYGLLIVILGASSGIIGVLFALGQHDLKRLLAYHSVENIGIILLGIGIGLVGRATGVTAVAVVGFAGGLLHVLNHALFKGLLFLGAGAVYHATGSRDLDTLGGLLKKMPLTGLFFLTGAIAISGLPPLNGFISEFLVYSSAFGALSGRGTAVASALIAIPSLALIGGLALACFTKAFGIVFLGEPRSSNSLSAHEPKLPVLLSMGMLAFGCVAIGVAFEFFLPIMIGPVSQLSGSGPDAALVYFVWIRRLLSAISAIGAVLAVFVLVAVMVRAVLLRRREPQQAGTWDCGYIAPSARMQYSASSFAQPLIDFFAILLQPAKREPKIRAFFPARAAFHSEVADVFAQKLFRPPSAKAGRLLIRIRKLQPARVHFFAGYIIFALILLILWNFYGAI